MPQRMHLNGFIHNNAILQPIEFIYSVPWNQFPIIYSHIYPKLPKHWTIEPVDQYFDFGGFLDLYFFMLYFICSSKVMLSF